MRERVVLYGGRSDAGRRPNGGFAPEAGRSSPLKAAVAKLEAHHDFFVVSLVNIDPSAG
jgi:hypothetical protein